MEPEMMPMAAKGKHRLMILCAGMPISSIAASALKKPSSTSGKRCMISVPQSMIVIATPKENFRASSIRSFLLAP